jgi:hypothetical protein
MVIPDVIKPGLSLRRVITELVGKTLIPSHVADVRGGTVRIGSGIECPSLFLRGDDILSNVTRNFLPFSS